MQFNNQEIHTILTALTSYEQGLNKQRNEIIKHYLNGGNKHQTLTNLMEFLDNSQRSINQVRNVIYSENK